MTIVFNEQAIRAMLGDIEESQLSDVAIRTAMDLAETEVDTKKRETASDDAVLLAKCNLAAYYAYRSYITVLERENYTISTSAQSLLRELKEAAERALEDVSMENYSGKIPPLAYLAEDGSILWEMGKRTMRRYFDDV